MKAASEFDLIVIGGGPAGATLATLVSQAGRSVLLVERERFPRYRVGESLLPATVHGICPMLGLSEAMRSAGFVERRGFAVQPQSGEPWSVDFSASPSFTKSTAYAYQVERSRFDFILLNNASNKGVEVRENSEVLGVLREAARVVGITCTDSSGQLTSCRSRFVADASGSDSTFFSEVGERAHSKSSENVAIHGYYRNGGPPRERRTLYVGFEGGWFWYTPLSDALISLGAVVSAARAQSLRDGPAAALRRLIADCPHVQSLLRGAEPITSGAYGEVRVCRGTSYSNTRFWSRGMLLIGDAACSVDPIFSAGVHLGTYSALLAARSINSCLAGQLDEDEAFLEFEMRYRREHASQQERSLLRAVCEQISGATKPDAAFVDLLAGIAVSREPLFSGAIELAAASVNGRNEFRNALRACDDFDVLRFDRAPIRHLAAATCAIDERGSGLMPTAEGLHWCRSAG